MKTIHYNKAFFILLSLMFLNLFTVLEIKARTIPTLTSPVMDEVGVLSSKYQTQLESVLYQLKNQSGIQLQFYFIDSLEDETIETYSIKVTDQWKLGNKDTDKGALFIIALRERKMRLEVGQGLEGDLTDLYSKRLLDSIRPDLKQGNYEAASFKILTGITDKLSINLNELNTLTPKKPKVQSLTGKGALLLFFLFIFLTILQKFLPVSGRHYHGRRRPFDVYYGGGNHGRGNGGGFGGGGGWSGGGGGFSGGGASSDW